MVVVLASAAARHLLVPPLSTSRVKPVVACSFLQAITFGHLGFVVLACMGDRFGTGLDLSLSGQTDFQACSFLHACASSAPHPIRWLASSALNQRWFIRAQAVAALRVRFVTSFRLVPLQLSNRLEKPVRASRHPCTQPMPCCPDCPTLQTRCPPSRPVATMVFKVFLSAR